MYIKSIKIQNFRSIKSLDLELNKHLNFIIWENDSWKTALIDALKLTLWTVSNDYFRLENDDFYNEEKEFIIEVVILDFNQEQAISFVDWWIENKDWEFWIKLKFKAEKKWEKIFSKTTAWPIESEDEWKYLEPDKKELLHSVYLKPLRDAQNDLNSGKSSRLSKILYWHKYFKWKEKNHELIKKFETLNVEIKEYFWKAPKWETEIINEIINKHFESFIWKEDYKKVFIDTWKPILKNILEKLSLEYENNKKPWLWTSNLLFIASELLLLNERVKEWLWVALIEELEAHIHPQKQLTLIDYLQKKSKEDNIQMFITSHSPNIASKVNLENVIICKKTKFYSLRKGATLLQNEDYKYLERWLDTTKADLFFAKWLIFVEWIAEAILLPVIADLFGINLNQKWISIINLNWLSFERYLKVFVSNKKTNYLDIKIACITDRDWKKIKKDDSWTDEEKKKMKKMKKEYFEKLVNSTSWIIEADFKNIDFDYEWVETIKYFHNKIKTLEYDLAVWDFFKDLLQARKNVKWIQKESDITGENCNYKKSFKLYKKIEDLKWDFAQELSFLWEEEMKDKTTKEALKTKFIKDPYIKYILEALEYVSWESILSTNNW